MATKRTALDDNTVTPSLHSVTRPQGLPVGQMTGIPADQPASTPVNSKYPTVSYRVDPTVAKAMRRLSVDLGRPIGELVQEAFTRLLEHYGS